MARSWSSATTLNISAMATIMVLVTTFAAASQGVTPDVVVERLLKFVPVELHERAKKRVQAGAD